MAGIPRISRSGRQVIFECLLRGFLFFSFFFNIIYSHHFSNGLVGRSCVLRSICESAHTSFDHSNGILGELLHVVMS